MDDREKTVLRLGCSTPAETGNVRARRRVVRQVAGHLLVLILATLATGVASASGRWLTDQTGRRVEVPERTRRLIALAPSVTEMIYALGLDDRLVGDTDYCNYPPAAKLKPRVGSLLNPSIERIVALRPDLVLGSPKANRREVAAQIERLKIPVYGVTAESVEDVLRSIQDLGDILGADVQARALTERLRRRIDAVERRVSRHTRPKVFFAVWFRPLTTTGKGTAIADVVERAGGTSVTNDLAGEWPRLSLEEVLRRDPDYILFPQSESFFPPVDELSRLPGWRDLRAVKNGRVHAVSEAITLQSPSLIDALEQVADILHPPATQEVGNQQ